MALGFIFRPPLVLFLIKKKIPSVLSESIETRLELESVRDAERSRSALGKIDERRVGIQPRALDSEFPHEVFERHTLPAGDVQDLVVVGHSG